MEGVLKIDGEFARHNNTLQFPTFLKDKTKIVRY